MTGWLGKLLLIFLFTCLQVGGFTCESYALAEPQLSAREQELLRKEKELEALLSTASVAEVRNGTVVRNKVLPNENEDKFAEDTEVKKEIRGGLKGNPVGAVATERNKDQFQDPQIDRPELDTKVEASSSSVEETFESSSESKVSQLTPESPVYQESQSVGASKEDQFNDINSGSTNRFENHISAADGSKSEFDTKVKAYETELSKVRLELSELKSLNYRLKEDLEKEKLSKDKIKGLSNEIAQGLTEKSKKVRDLEQKLEEALGRLLLAETEIERLNDLLVSKESEGEAPKRMLQYPVMAAKQRYVFALKGTKLYTGPGGESKVITELPLGEKLLLGKNYATWYQVKTRRGVKGWVSISSISFNDIKRPVQGQIGINDREHDAELDSQLTPTPNISAVLPKPGSGDLGLTPEELRSFEMFRQRQKSK